DVRLRRSGMRAIEVEQGVLLFAHLLAAQATQMGVMSVDWARAASEMNASSKPVFESLVEARHAPQPADKDLLRRTFEALPQEQRKAFLIERIGERVSAVMGLHGSVDPHQPLRELGLDSLMAVELRNDLARELGRELPATMLFDYPSVDALASFVLSELAPPPAAAPPETSGTWDEELDAIEQLSDAEIEQMLGAVPGESSERREWATIS
ncbi:MAG TPA: beta-ketoacyl reductase, partial [Burkholderiales bacterium]|nr:beta-ketoacyl reductase [Burkholderiales bacterium]